ncbi:MAG: hypothetical protein H7Z10_16430 [Gemmatimonadaceae bacterium]|nr:hypothetical protein [Acetobacteraceae bacterium]
MAVVQEAKETTPATAMPATRMAANFTWSSGAAAYSVALVPSSPAPQV